jgi:hypothetical protein
MTEKKKNGALAVTLPPALLEKIKKAAELCGVSPNALVAKAIEDQFDGDIASIASDYFRAVQNVAQARQKAIDELDFAEKVL